jgi:hypothetical protein
MALTPLDAIKATYKGNTNTPSTTPTSTISSQSNIGKLPPYLQNLNKGGMSVNTAKPTPTTAQMYPQSPNVAKVQNQVLGSSTTVSNLTNAPSVTPSLTSNSYNTPLGGTTGTTGMIGTSETTPTTPTTPARGGREDVLSRLLALTEKQGTQSDRTLALEKEYELQAKQETLNSLNAKALTIDRDYENRKRSIMENPEGKTTSGLSGEIRNLERERDTQLADIGIQQAVAQGNVDLVNKNIERRVKAEFDPLKTQVEGLKNYLTLYSDDLTTSEKVLLEAELKRQQTDYENGTKSANLEAQASSYQQLLDSGAILSKDIPKEVLARMNFNGYVTPEQKQSKEMTTGLISSINKFFDLGATGAVGAPVSKFLPWLGSLVGVGNYNADKSLVENIKNKLTLNNLGFLKGAMSDKDIAFITGASSALNDKMSESQFKKELINIQSAFTNGIVNSPAYSLDEKKDALSSQFLREDPKATNEQIAEMVRLRLQSFNQVGNTSASNIQIPKESRLSYVNNNPANLRFAGQTGASKGEGGFARFETPEAGIQALQNQIKLDASRGLTLSQFINKFAPPSENDTQTYIKQVQQMTGARPSQKISGIDINLLTKAIAKKESSTNIA